MAHIHITLDRAMFNDDAVFDRHATEYAAFLHERLLTEFPRVDVEVDVDYQTWNGGHADIDGDYLDECVVHAVRERAWSDWLDTLNEPHQRIDGIPRVIE